MYHSQHAHEKRWEDEDKIQEHSGEDNVEENLLRKGYGVVRVIIESLRVIRIAGMIKLVKYYRITRAVRVIRGSQGRRFSAYRV